MLYDTILVIVLAISTIIILHIVLAKYIDANADASVETFIRGLSRPFPHRPLIVPAPINGHSTPCQPHPPSEGTTHPTVNEVPPPTANDVSNHSLETELKQWMQQEAMNWSAPATPITPQPTTSSTSPTDSTTTHKMSTSIDKLFAEQQVQLDDVQMPTTLTSTSTSTPTSTTTTTTKPKNTNTVNYSNTMNSGDLGDGLSAFDSLESSFATI